VDDLQGGTERGTQPRSDEDAAVGQSIVNRMVNRRHDMREEASDEPAYP
jgi:hypothetical protein